MSKKNLLLLIFVVLALGQLAVPGYMIVRQEKISCSGKVFKIRTALVDPHDPFRGRYVRLGFDLNFKKQGENAYGRKVFAVPAVGADGFAYIAAVSDTLPADGIGFPATIGWSSNQDMVRINPQFSRYYLNEAAAPKAEKLYLEAVRKKNSWVEVRIYDGQAALTGLFLDGRPILEVVGGK